MYQNYTHFFRRKGKVIFVQSQDGKRIGEWILNFIESKNLFPENFYHYQPGGHVAALHRHISNKYFFRIDISNFFYSIPRNRVAKALHEHGVSKARTYAKWSCVNNPLGNNPAYSLPIGFIQSSALATLVLLRSPVMSSLQLASSYSSFASVYLDDIIASSSDLDQLSQFYLTLLNALEQSNFLASPGKLMPPASQINAFNCELKYGSVQVSEIRTRAALQNSDISRAAFLKYCDYVSSRNHVL
jgi:hypothetical protein